VDDENGPATDDERQLIGLQMSLDGLKGHFVAYSERLSGALARFDWTPVEALTADLLECWKTGNQVFFCGNGDSAGNANHVANDFMYPVSKRLGSGIRAHSLSENPAVLTCLGNDEGYDNIYAFQLATVAREGDILVVFSGSGNSANILRVLEEAKRRGVKTYAVLGYSGGTAKTLADVPIHFEIDDMQIAEDTQTIICHMIVQWLYTQRDLIEPTRG
jgi:D-sedoheptulose 7-phosphate isomerase